MRPGRLLILALVVLGFGVFIYFFERQKPTTDELAERKDKLFADLDQEKARRIVIDNSHGHFELVKEAGEWRLTAPIADNANQGAVSSLLSTLRTLKAERTLPAAGLKLADYGLDKPQLTASVEDESGKTFALRLGNELPLGNSRALTTGGGDVYVVSKYIATDVERDLAGWRSDQLVQVYSSDVASVSIASPAGRVALANTSGVWTITEPFADLADRDRAEGLISDLNAARIKEFIDAPGDLAALGLAKPALEVNLVRKDKPPVKLEFGAEREKDGAKQTACRRGERVFWVDDNARTRAVATVVEWRSSSLVRLDTWAAEKLELVAGAAKAALERKDGVWKAGDVEVDGDAVSRRLNTLADLKVTAFDRPKPGGEPEGTVKVTVRDGAVVEVSFFQAAGAGEATAVVPGRSGAFAVDGARVGEILSDPAALTRPKPTPTPQPTVGATPTPEAPEE